MMKLAHRVFCAALPLALIAVLTLSLSRISYAGEWVLDSYVYSGATHSDNQGWSTYGGYRRTVSDPFYRETVDRSSITEGRGRFGASAQLTLSANRNYGANAPTANGWPVKAGKASVAITVRPVFAWQRREIYNPDTGDSSPDPNDNPNLSQRLYVFEESSASASRHHSNSGDWPDGLYTVENPFRGAWMPLEEVSNGLKSPLGLPEMYYSYYGGPVPQGLTNRCSGNRFKAITPNKLRRNDQGKEVFDGPAIHISGLIKSNAYNFASYTEAASANLSFSYEVRIVRFEIFARRKGSALDPKIFTGFDGYASIAAGHKMSDEHQAEILLSARIRGDWGSPAPVPGIVLSQLPKLRLYNEKGVEKDAKLLPPSDPETPAADKPVGHTDSSGSIIINRVLSRDLTVINTGHTYVTLADNVYNPSGQSNHAIIYQNWGEVEWRMGESGERPYNTNFFLSGAEYNEWIWTKVSVLRGQVPNGKPLKGHAMKFVCERLVVREKDANGQWVSKIFTTNPSDTGDHVTSQEDIDALVTNYITLPEAEESGGGIYKGQLTIKKSADFIVESYKLAIEDQGVYRKKN